MRDLNELNQFRHLAGERQLSPIYGNPEPHNLGLFMIPHKGVVLRILASAAEGWDHVSVSLAERCPTWEEMDFIKREFFKDLETAMQLHVPPSAHINCHPYCLHLWRPHYQEIPLPPPEMVGPRK